jgi:hypothetical protein
MTTLDTLIATEDQGSFDSVVPIRDLLDRLELITENKDDLVLLRRIYNDQDLSSVFRLASDDQDLRRAAMEQNLHSVFRVLSSYEVRVSSHEDLRKAVVEQNLHSLFRVLESFDCKVAAHEDLRKAILEQNLHSIFRVLAQSECVVGTHEDLRKAVTEQNLHAIFRVLENTECLAGTHEDLRKAVTEQNLHAIFRLLEHSDDLSPSHEDLRKAVIEQNLHSIFRCYAGVDDIRRAVMEQNLHSLFRCYSEVDDLRKAVLDQNLHSIFRCYGDRTDLDVSLDDVRKAVLDQQLNSIFRLYRDNDDLRKAVVDQNMISLFRLIGQEDLAKFVLQDNRFAMYRLINRYTATALVPALKRLEEQGQAFYQDSLSRGQIQSKLWLVNQVNELDLDLGVVFLCAGWYATLALMLFESGTKIGKIRSFDLDPDCESLAELFNKPWVIDQWRFKASTMDILDMDYHGQTYTVRRNDGGSEELYDVPDTIINTSCEHIEEFRFWYERIPEGKLVILQNNDYKDIPDHVNCCQDLEDFATQTPMRRCLYQGELNLGRYKRFMRIGYK